jgi:threonine dehydrogenase-like Zn-dependent dehydrogenase
MVRPEGIVTHRWPLGELPQAFDTQRATDRSVKVLVYP